MFRLVLRLDFVKMRRSAFDWPLKGLPFHLYFFDWLLILLDLVRVLWWIPLKFWQSLLNVAETFQFSTHP